MRLGTLGLPKSGKTTLFNILTASRQDTDKFVASRKTNLGVASVADPRLARLRDLYQPRRFVPATIEYVDIPGLKQGDRESLDLPNSRTVDALVHVVRAFSDPEILHPGGVDPARDIVTVNLELILADHELVTRRLGRLEAARKRGLSEAEKREQKLLAEVVLEALEAETPLRELSLGADEERILRGFQLLSAKPMLVAINVDEEDITRTPESLAPKAGPGVETVVISARIEEEISRLEPADQGELLAELNLEESSTSRMIRVSYKLLGLISFFTVGKDEVRAWTLRKGCRARQAAGAVHSDIERGFIRAEVVDWQDLVRHGSLAACRDQGVLRVEGRDYEVKDGEVVHFRFNV